MLLKDGDSYPIQPWDIKTHKVFIGAFGKFEMEYTARLIVMHCKVMEGWRPFTREQLRERFPEESAGAKFNLKMLAARKLIL